MTDKATTGNMFASLNKKKKPKQTGNSAAFDSPSEPKQSVLLQQSMQTAMWADEDDEDMNINKYSDDDGFDTVVATKSSKHRNKPFPAQSIPLNQPAIQNEYIDSDGVDSTSDSEESELEEPEETEPAAKALELKPQNKTTTSSKKKKSKNQNHKQKQNLGDIDAILSEIKPAGESLVDVNKESSKETKPLSDVEKAAQDAMAALNLSPDASNSGGKKKKKSKGKKKKATNTPTTKSDVKQPAIDSEEVDAVEAAKRALQKIQAKSNKKGLSQSEIAAKAVEKEAKERAEKNKNQKDKSKFNQIPNHLA